MPELTRAAQASNPVVAIDNTTGVRTRLDDLREDKPTATWASAHTAGTATGDLQQAKAPPGYGPAGAEAAGGVSPGTDSSASWAGGRDIAAANGMLSRARPGTAEATGYNAQTGEVDDSMSVSSQMDKITSKDSAIMRRAALQGMLSAARRGLGNSSFAAGAAMAAMADRALPIAQQDASTNFTNMRDNMGYLNRAREVSTGRETDVSALNAQLETAVSQGNAEAANRIRMQLNELAQQTEIRNAEMANAMEQFNASQANEQGRFNANTRTSVSMSNAERQTQVNALAYEIDSKLNSQYMAGSQAMDLASIQGRYQQLIAANTAAAQVYDSYINAIGSAMANDRVTPGRVAQYVNVMKSQLEGSLAFIDEMNSLDLSRIDVPGATATASGIAPAPGTNSVPPLGFGADERLRIFNFDIPYSQLQ